MSRRQIAKNIAALYSLQAAQFVVPLLTTPYLARVLGVEQFGVLGVASALVSYLVLVADWGFNYSAVQAVARNAADPDALRRIFWNTLAAKSILGLACAVGLALFTLFTPELHALSLVLIATSPALLSSVLGINWFLQGLEKMGAYAFVAIASRVASLPLIFLFVHSPNDTWIAALAQTGALIVSNIAGFAIAGRAARLMPVSGSLRGAAQQIRAGFRLFLSTGAMTVYTSSNVVVLAFLAGPLQAGYLAGAERMKRAAQSGVGPISMTMYPRINNMMVHARGDVKKAMLRMVVLQGAAGLAISIAMFLVAPWLTITFLGRDFVSAIPVAQWLAAAPFLVGLNVALGVNIMVPMGMERAFMWVTLAACAVNLAVLVPLCVFFGAVGAAIAAVLTEAFVTCSIALCLLLRYRSNKANIAKATP